jgi:hypothetical protein
MVRRLLFLVPLLCLSLMSKAQVINDPQQAIAARDTLFKLAEQLRQSVQKQVPFFATNATTRSKRRVVVKGVATPPFGLTHLPFSWKQVTIYRRNNRVQQHFTIEAGGVLVLREYRLNNQVLWLSLPGIVPGSGGKLPRHVGTYYQSGFVTLDRQGYVLPPM